MSPDWLPPKLSLRGTSVTEDYAVLHDIFARDLLGASLAVDGFTVLVDTGMDNVMPEFERGFMHLVTKEDGSGTRTIDYNRACKICWVRPVIENYMDPEVYSFWYQGPREQSLYLWLADHDFVVILRWYGGRGERKKIIVTAFHVDASYRRSLTRKYGNAQRIL